MRCERFALSGDPSTLVEQLRALIPAPTSVAAVVAQMIDRVRKEGDAAVLEYTRVLDTRGTDPQPLRVRDEELDAAAEAMNPEVRRAVEQAIANVERVARTALRTDTRLI